MLAERRAFRLEIKAASDEGVIEGYASVFGNVDQGYDVVEPGAFTRTIEESGGAVPILWGHDPYEPIGVSQALTEDEHGLKMTARLALETRRGAEALALAKLGALKGLSIGYRTVKEAYNGALRRLLEVQLLEVSMVTFPMNEQAQILSAKHADAAAWAAVQREIKAGRVLSAASKTLLEQALQAIQALLASAEPPTEGTSSEDGAADKADPSAAPPEPARAPLVEALSLLTKTYQERVA